MRNTLSHNTNVDRCDFRDHTDHSVSDVHSHSIEMPLRTAGPEVGVPNTTDLSPG